MATLIVFSHLRWNFVYQRPQHLLSRMAQRCGVLFVEEPVHDTEEARLERIDAGHGIEVLRPHMPLRVGGFDEPALQRLLEARLAQGIERPLYAWAYTPMALPLIKTLQPDKIIYDCMDALTHFKYAPPQLAEREEALLQHADVVFCGGVSLYRARADKHRNIHCFPSSVDAAHFARPGGTHGAEDIQAGVPRPRLGYCGVIDERIDLDLVSESARARPDWQFVLVGPIVKIEPTQVPVLPNVHHFGQQPYAELPRFMAGWDVAIMPFALNDATRFISPTKTLEYLAADRPVVSTPVADVVAAYAGVVEIASNSAEFVAACERLLNETGDAREARRAAMRRCVATTSWEKTAGEMWALVEAAPLKSSRASPARIERLAKRRGAVPQPADDDTTPVAKSA
jgi:UDP-galactopyranose mutase